MGGLCSKSEDTLLHENQIKVKEKGFYVRFCYGEYGGSYYSKHNDELSKRLFARNNTVTFTEQFEYVMMKVFSTQSEYSDDFDFLYTAMKKLVLEKDIIKPIHKCIKFSEIVFPLWFYQMDSEKLGFVFNGAVRDPYGILHGLLSDGENISSDFDINDVIMNHVMYFRLLGIKRETISLFIENRDILCKYIMKKSLLEMIERYYGIENVYKYLEGERVVSLDDVKVLKTIENVVIVD